MKFRFLIFVAIFTALGFFVSNYYNQQAGSDKATTLEKTPPQETLLEKVKRTGVIRCGYSILPPFLIRDPNTGKFTGMFYDLVEEIGRQLSLEIDWAVESVPAHIFSDLANKRVDAICSIYYVTPARAREGSFSATFLYHPTYMYTRIDDKRFDNNYKKANDKTITFATIDGEFSAASAKELFPKGKKYMLPQHATGGDLMLAVATKKADVVVTEHTYFVDYNKNNPGILKRVAGGPLRVLPASFPLPLNEPDFKNTIDETINYLHSTGYIDKLLAKYETPEVKFLRMAKPYSTE